MSPQPRSAGRPVRALLVAVVLAAAALTACGGGGGDDSGGSASIVVTHGYTDAEATALKAAVATWNQQHPDGKVSLQFNGGNDSALQKTVAGFTAGNYPDVSYQYGSSAAQLAKQPKLVDLTDKVAAPSVHWDDFYPSAREASTVDGKVVGVPALIDNLSLVYNKKLFADAGVAPPTNDWTWQDFRDAAAKLTDAGSHTYGWAYVNDGSEDTVWRFLALLWQAGGSLLNEDNTQAAFDSDAGTAALQQLEDMAVTDKSVYLDQGNGNYLEPLQRRQDRHAVDRALGPVEHQLRRAVRRDLPARLQRQPRDDLGPGPLPALRPLRRPCRHRLRLRHLADLGRAAPEVRDRHG